MDLKEQLLCIHILKPSKVFTINVFYINIVNVSVDEAIDFIVKNLFATNAVESDVAYLAFGNL